MMSGRLLASFAVAVGAIACSTSGSQPTEAGVEPSLAALSVSAPLDPSLTLVPPFSSSIYDYYVRCAPGTNALTVSITASPGSDSLLLQPTPSGSAQAQNLSLRVNENQAIVAAATNGVATTEYWVRCLPHDFPTMQIVAHSEKGTPTPGYYLIGAKHTAKSAAYAIVLDSHGVPVWYTRPVPSSTDLLEVDSLVAGSVSFVPSLSSPFEIHYLSPLMTAYVAPTDKTLDNHELRHLSNGHYLVISNGVVSGVDLTGLTLPLPDGGVQALGPDSNIQACDIVEFDSTGAVVWQWMATDHLDPAQDSVFPQPSPASAAAPDGGTVVDPFHCNSIDVDPKNGNLLVSSRHLDSVFYIDRSTSKIVWKMGGATYTKDDAAYVSVRSPFHRQHDARLQPGWSSECSGGTGQISMFDDETAEPGPARGVVYNVNVGASDGGTGDCDGGPAGVATVAWEYKGQFTSVAMGGFRISAGGSRVIAWGAYAPSDLVFTELDANGNDLLDFYFTDGAISYRAVKVPLTQFDRSALRNTAGLPLP